MRQGFRYNIYPYEMQAELTGLTPEEAGVLLHIVLMTFNRQQPILYDTKYIGRHCELTPKRTKKIVERLLIKEKLFLIDGKIFHTETINELEDYQKRREDSAKKGKMGAEKRWGSEENQRDRNGSSKISEIASTSTDTNNSIKINTNTDNGNVVQFDYGASNPLHYNVEKYLTDTGWERAKAAAPGWDIYYLIQVYDEYTNTGNRAPPRSADAAFPAWCERYTKGEKPS